MPTKEAESSNLESTDTAIRLKARRQRRKKMRKCAISRLRKHEGPVVTSNFPLGLAEELELCKLFPNEKQSLSKAMGSLLWKYGKVAVKVVRLDEDDSPYCQREFRVSLIGCSRTF